MALLPDLSAWALVLAVGLPTIVFAIEVLLGARTRRADAPSVRAATPRTRILIPAHNEELGIGATLERLIAGLPAGMAPLVVADNCTDRTAEIARDRGVEAVERQDPTLRGKGYALAFGRDHLRSDPPECVIVLDADCMMSPADLGALASGACHYDTAVQATNLQEPDLAAAPMVQVSNFALAVKNSVRQRGLARLGAPALLTGTGMAFPWHRFEPLPLASASLAEDLELGIALTASGHRSRFVPEALVLSRAGNASATLVQRSRWEGGFLAMARRHALPLIGSGIAKRNWQLLWLGLHLATPPLSLLVLLNMMALVAIAVLDLLGAGSAPLVVMLAAVAALGIALVAAWFSVGRDFLSPRAAARLPFYLFWKIPLYLKLAKGGDKKWIRTERSG